MCRGRFLAACTGLLLSWYYHGLSVATEPGFLDFDNLPETNFSCEGKVIGGYYADTETGCQMFHVCTIGQKGEVTDIKFLCLNGTVFDQETRVCERLDEVDCSKSESFYDLNLELYGNNAAGFGIQPESEDTPDNLCEEEDEEECKTEKPSAPVKPSPTEQVKVSSDEREDEMTTQPPLSSSTTSRRPVTSTIFPSTTPAPQILQFPSSSPETIAALLALHNAFTQSLQQHSHGKDKVNPPKITGFVESLNAEKSTQEAETFEIKDGQTFSSRVPTPFPSKTQTQYTVPSGLSKSQFQNSPKPQFQNSPKPQFTSPLKPQFQSPPKTNYQSPPKSQFQIQPKPQFQTQPKSPAPITHQPVTFPKPIHTTSERFGNIPFRHSFHINSQVTHFHEPNYQDQYSDHESQPSSQPQTEAPKQYDFGDYEDDYYDEKPHSSTITPYLLHQLKVNQVQSASQPKVGESSNHGSFVREVSSSSKPFNVPSYRSVTTPGIAIITATSTTSSSSVKTGKPLPSAIQPFKKHPTGTGFGGSLLHSSNSNDTEHFLDPLQSYDDYKEGDVRSDPFYKDVPKISRSKRNLENYVVKTNSVNTIDSKTLRKLKDKLLNSVFELNSEYLLHAILNEYCKNIDSSDSLVSYCMNDNYNDRVGDERLTGNDEWKIVVPEGNSDFLYLIRTISSSNEYQNTTSNILLLVHFPSEFKFIRDSIIKELENKHGSDNLRKNLETNSVNSSVHHRFKRVKRDNIKGLREKIGQKATMRKSLLKKQEEKTYTRLKRQTESYEGVESESVGLPLENRREGTRPSARQNPSNENQQRTRKVVRKRPHSTELPDEPITQQVNPRRPTRRRQPNTRPQTIVQTSIPGERNHENINLPVEFDNSRHSSNSPSQRRQHYSQPHLQAQTELPVETVQVQSHPQDQFHGSEYGSPQRLQPSSRSQFGSQSALPIEIVEEQTHAQEESHGSKPSSNIPFKKRQPSSRPHSNFRTPLQLDSAKQLSHPQVEPDTLPVSGDKLLTRPSAGRRKQGTRYHFCEGPRCSAGAEETSDDTEVEVSTTYPFNLKPGTTFNCDDKIKGGYYADVEAECYGYFICSQGAVGGPLLKSHFWCGPTTKFNQRSRTCQAEANVACSVSHRYFHLNKDILSLPDPDDLVRDSFEPSKVKS